ncbi:3-dehydroquinate synthase [Bacillus sp. DJP31]|uniref:3-dehydroquinate synthase n=1 Tax=Bacillus sp. DJP31 TaxID=3409789 RepID=UPI003BB67798
MKELLIRTVSKEYPLLIGSHIFEQTDMLTKIFEGKPSSILVLTDDNIAPLYLENLIQLLSPYAPVYSKVIPSGEASKSIDQFYECQTFALEKNLDRHSMIVAFGGGVIGDLAGFVAATFMRGIKFIQVPTTLLAHDSAVGGKVAVNHQLGKNTIGAFYQPEAVIYDLSFLKTLPTSECRAGFAELIKHSLIWDENFYPWLRENIKTMEDLKGTILEDALIRAIMIKATIVGQDELETGIRAYLNFGHTLAHALEAELGYGKMSHGDAVAIGMIFAMKVSEMRLQVTLPIKELQDWFDLLGFPRFPKAITATSVLQRMKKDKKAMNGNIRMSLMKEIGSLTVTDVEDHLLLNLLQKECKEE